MSKKPQKIEETTTSYTIKNSPDSKSQSPLKHPVATPDDATFKKVTDKIFSERKELLHKLAQ